MKPLYYIAQRSAKAGFGGLYDLRVIGADKIIEDRAAIYASNHVSFFDPPLMASCFKREIYFFARKTLFKRPMVGWLFRRLNSIPVDQDRPDFTSLKTVIARLREGGRVLIFPEGSRTLDGELLPGSPGVGLMVAKTKVPVIPVHIFGAYEALPRGDKFPRPSQITVVFGDAIDFEKGEVPGKGKELYQGLAQRIMDRISLLKRPPEGGPTDHGRRP